MKLRFVKFFTSRENEIEKKEEEGSTTTACSTIPQPGRDHSPPLPLSSPSSLHLSHSLSLHPAPPTYLLRRPSLSAATYRESNILQLSPPPAVPLLPFFFIKLLKQQSVAVVTWRSTQLADPAVTGGRPARRHPCSFTQSDGRGFSPVLIASSLWRVEP